MIIFQYNQLFPVNSHDKSILGFSVYKDINTRLFVSFYKLLDKHDGIQFKFNHQSRLINRFNLPSQPPSTVGFSTKS